MGHGIFSFGSRNKIECPYCHDGIMVRCGTISEVGKWATANYACGNCGNGVYITAGKSRDGKRYRRKLGEISKGRYGTDIFACIECYEGDGEPCE